MAPLIKALRNDPEFQTTCISTQQHSSLLHETLGAVAVDTDIELPEPDRSSVQSALASILGNLEEPLLDCDSVVVQGDTVSAFAGALAGFLQGKPVIHLEAGLRTSTLLEPHPEEGLRRAISHMASLHLAPTPGARQNLEAEGIGAESIVVTGNTSIDAILDHLNELNPKVTQRINATDSYCVVTVHRRENWGEPLDRIAQAVNELALQFPQVDFICPLHPNPKVRESFTKLKTGTNLRVIDPIPHDDFVTLLAGSLLILTDSGGIQEEATVLKVPVVILRDETERPEVVTAGIGFIAGTQTTSIHGIAERILTSRLNSEFEHVAKSPFGDGRAGVRSAAAIKAYLSGKSLPTDMTKLGINNQ